MTMKKTVKKETVMTVYNSLKGALVGSLEDRDKFAVVRAMRVLKPMAVEMEEFVGDAREKLKPEGFDEAREKARKFDSLPEQEKAELNALAEAYNDSVARCVSEELGKEVELELEPVGEEAVCVMGAASNFDISTIMTVQDVLCE